MATFLALLLEHQDCDRYSWGYSFACIQQGRMSTPETVVANNELNQFMNQGYITLSGVNRDLKNDRTTPRADS
nr:hypothetical protein [Tanacetum cinerariifolium]